MIVLCVWVILFGSKLREGHRQAAKRRVWARQENERREASLKGSLDGKCSGQGLTRHGQFAIPW